MDLPVRVNGHFSVHRGEQGLTVESGMGFGMTPVLATPTPLGQLEKLQELLRVDGSRISRIETALRHHAEAWRKA